MSAACDTAARGSVPLHPDSKHLPGAAVPRAMLGASTAGRPLRAWSVPCGERQAEQEHRKCQWPKCPSGGGLGERTVADTQCEAVWP